MKLNSIKNVNNCLIFLVFVLFQTINSNIDFNPQVFLRESIRRICSIPQDIVCRILPFSEFRSIDWLIEKLGEISSVIKLRDDITEDTKEQFNEIVDSIKDLKEVDPNLLNKLVFDEEILYCIKGLQSAQEESSSLQDEFLTTLGKILQQEGSPSSYEIALLRLIEKFNFYTFTKRLKEGRLKIDKEYGIFPYFDKEIYLWGWGNKILLKWDIPNEEQGEVEVHFKYALAVEMNSVRLIVKFKQGQEETFDIPIESFFSTNPKLNEEIGTIELDGKKVKFILTKATLFLNRIPIIFNVSNISKSQKKMEEVEQIYEKMSIRINNYIFFPTNLIVLQSDDRAGGRFMGNGKIGVNINSSVFKIAGVILHEGTHGLFSIYKIQFDLFKERKEYPLDLLPNSIKVQNWFISGAVSNERILGEAFTHLIELDFFIKAMKRFEERFKEIYKIDTLKDWMRKEQNAIEDALNFLATQEAESLTEEGVRFLERLSLESELIKEKIDKITED
jgi:hypothetical protein